MAEHPLDSVGVKDHEKQTEVKIIKKNQIHEFRVRLLDITLIMLHLVDVLHRWVYLAMSQV